MNKKILLVVTLLIVAVAISVIPLKIKAWKTEIKKQGIEELLQSTDNQPNGITRVTNNEKQYLLLRYLGGCLPTDVMSITISDCKH